MIFLTICLPPVRRYWSCTRLRGFAIHFHKWSYILAMVKLTSCIHRNRNHYIFRFASCQSPLDRDDLLEENDQDHNLNRYFFRNKNIQVYQFQGARLQIDFWSLLLHYAVHCKISNKGSIRTSWKLRNQMRKEQHKIPPSMACLKHGILFRPQFPGKFSPIEKVIDLRSPLENNPHLVMSHTEHLSCASTRTAFCKTWVQLATTPWPSVPSEALHSSTWLTFT